MATSTVSLKGEFNRSEVVVNTKLTANCDVVAEGNIAIGRNAKAEGNVSHAEGVNVTNESDNSFVWNGDPTKEVTDAGDGTFKVNTPNGITDVVINDKNLKEHIETVSPNIRTSNNEFTGTNKFTKQVTIENELSSVSINGGSVAIRGTESSNAGISFKYDNETNASAKITETASGKLTISANDSVHVPMPAITESTDSTQAATVGFVNQRVSHAVTDPSLDDESLTIATTSFTHKLVREYLDQIFSSTDDDGYRHSVIKESNVSPIATLMLGLPDYQNVTSMLSSIEVGYQFENDGYMFVRMEGTEEYPSRIEVDNVLVAYDNDKVSTYFFPVAKGSIITALERGKPDQSGIISATFCPVKNMDDLTNGQHDILEMKWLDYKLPADSKWKRQDGWKWTALTAAPQAYEHLYQEYEEGTKLTDTYTLSDGSLIVINYSLAADGHKIVSASSEDGLSVLKKLFEDTGSAWYYVVDETNQRFQLPHTSAAFSTIHDDTVETVGTTTKGSVPNVTGSMYSYENNLSATGGAFITSGNTGQASFHITGGKGTISSIQIDASRCSTVYGASKCVRPGGALVYLYFYVGGEYDVGNHTVTFRYSKDGVLIDDPEYISTVTVRHGRYVTIPAAKSVPNCQFAGWYNMNDTYVPTGSMVRIVADTTFVAKFYKHKTLKFIDTWNGGSTTLKSYLIVNGHAYDDMGREDPEIIYPSLPQHDGYETSWDRPGIKIVDIVDTLTIVSTVYTAIEDEYVIINDDDRVYDYPTDDPEESRQLTNDEIAQIVFVDEGLDGNNLICLDIASDSSYVMYSTVDYVNGSLVTDGEGNRVLGTIGHYYKVEDQTIGRGEWVWGTEIGYSELEDAMIANIQTIQTPSA